jgi:hypothetical protein
LLKAQSADGAPATPWLIGWRFWDEYHGGRSFLGHAFGDSIGVVISWKLPTLPGYREMHCLWFKTLSMLAARLNATSIPSN